MLEVLGIARYACHLEKEIVSDLLSRERVPVAHENRLHLPPFSARPYACQTLRSHHVETRVRITEGVFITKSVVTAGFEQRARRGDDGERREDKRAAIIHRVSKQDPTNALSAIAAVTYDTT